MSQSRLIRSHELLGWRAWYTGGRVFCSATTPWGRLPDDGVLAVLLIMEPSTADLELGHAYHTRTVLQSDWYFRWQDSATGDVVMGGHSDDRQAMEPRYPGVEVKRGRWVADHEWETLLKTVLRVQDEIRGGAVWQ